MGAYAPIFLHRILINNNDIQTLSALLSMTVNKCGEAIMMLKIVNFSQWRFGGQFSLIKVGTSDGILFSLFVVLLLSFLAADTFAASQLTITPTRIVFSDKVRSASATIINTGDNAGTYRISLVNKRMSPDGGFEDVKKPMPEELFSDKMIRFSPRQVVLEPGKTQVIRLGLRKPSNLKDGEYRSHMLFRAIPQEAGKTVQEGAKKSSGITISLTAIVGISIPVIVRHGKTDAEVSFVSARFVPRQAKEDRPHITVELERKGNRSVYGDFLAEFVTNDGERKVVAQVGGVAIYTPGSKRLVKLPIKAPPGLELTNGTLQIFYRSPVAQGGKVMAQTQIKIP
jgi:P pilus assembly chaperone PapD